MASHFAKRNSSSASLEGHSEDSRQLIQDGILFGLGNPAIGLGDKHEKRSTRHARVVYTFTRVLVGTGSKAETASGGLHVLCGFQNDTCAVGSDANAIDPESGGASNGKDGE